MVHSSVSKYGTYLTIAHELLQKPSFQGSVTLFKSFCILYLYVLVNAHQIDGIYACPFAEQTKHFVGPLNIGSGQEKERTLVVKSLQVEFTQHKRMS